MPRKFRECSGRKTGRLIERTWFLRGFLQFAPCCFALRLDSNKRLLSGRSDLPLAGLPSEQPSSQKNNLISPARPLALSSRTGYFLK